MDWTLEVVILPVSDLDRAIAFYRDQVGFELDHDTTNGTWSRPAHPPRVGLLDRHRQPALAERDGARLDARACSSCVADAAAARDQLVGRGVEAARSRCSTSATAAPSSASADPDGNTWAVQQIKVRGEKPLIPVEARGRFGE